MAISLERVAEEAIALLAPLPSYFSSTSAISSIFNRLGYAPSVAGLAPIAADISQLSDDINALVELGEKFQADREAGAAGLSELLELIQTIGRILDRLSQLPGKLPALNLAPSFFTDFLSLFLVDYLDQQRPGLRAFLEFIGAVEQVYTPVQPGVTEAAFYKIEFRWNRVLDFVQHPGQWAEDLYGWGTPNFAHAVFLLRLSSIIDSFGLFAPVVEIAPDILTKYYPSGVNAPVRPQAIRLPLYQDEPQIGTTIEIGLMGMPVEGKQTPISDDVGIGLIPYSEGVAEGTLAISPELDLVFKGSADVAGGLVIALRPKSGLELNAGISNVASNARLRLELRRKPAPGKSTVVLLGKPDSLRLDAQQVFLGGGVEIRDMRPDVIIEGGVNHGRVVITMTEADGFLAKVLPPDGIEFKFEFGVGWSSSKGLFFHGSGGLETTLSLNTTLGPIILKSLWISLGVAQEGVKLELGVTGGVAIGPVSASIDRVGMEAFLQFEKGNLGPVDLGFGFRPPTGIGVAIAAGPVNGGGYISLDYEKGRYSGTFQLQVLSVAVKVIGLLDTKLPDGRPGYSFLLIITTEFSPIQLGYGFTLNGVGGLAGINRTINAEALRLGVYSGSLDHILFPRDPVRNAPQLISDLSLIFPPAEGQYTFGPMAKLGWGAPTLIEISLGIIIELPSPVRIALLGQIGMFLPKREAAIVEIHLDFVAMIDFGTKLLSLDATLRDSRIVVFTLSGDMALRLCWGDQPNFAVALGGFHPHFPTPPGFPALRRLTLALGAGDAIRLTCQAYQALTTNSLQFGARVELFVDVGVYVHGWIGFDALFIFSPFSFQVDFTAGLEVAVGSVKLAGVSFEGTLSGPTPWRIRGQATLSVLFFEITAKVDEKFGDEHREELPPVDPWDKLHEALIEVRNWSATPLPGTAPVVSVAAPLDTTVPMLDPSGRATWRQKVVPLNRTVTRFGSAPTPSAVKYSVDRVSVESAQSTFGAVTDFFPPAQFNDLTDAEKLSRPSFESMDAGIALGGDAVDLGPSIPTEVYYETKLIDSEIESRRGARFGFGKTAHLALAKGGVIARAGSVRSGMQAFAGTSKLKQGGDRFVVVSTTDLSQHGSIATGATKGAATEALETYLREQPAERGKWQVVPEHEMEAA